MALYGLRPVPEIQFADFIYPGLRPDRERAGQVPLPLGRRVPGAGGDPHARRRRHPRRPLPLAVARGALHPHAGPEGRLPVEPVRREGPAARVRSAAERPGALLRAEARLPRRARATCPRATTRSPLGKAQGRARGHARHRARVGRDAARGARGGARRRAAQGIDLRGHRPAHALAARHRHRPRRRSRRPAASSSCTRRRGPAASAPSWSARIHEQAILHLEAPILRVTGFDTPFPYTLEHEYLPDADRILGRDRDALELLSRWPSSSSCPTSAKASPRARSSRWLVKEGDVVARGPADGRGDDRQGDGRDPVAARRARRQAHVRRGPDLPGRHGADRASTTAGGAAGGRRRAAGAGRRASPRPPARRAAAAAPRARGVQARVTAAAGARRARRVLATPATRKLARELGVDLRERARRPGRAAASPPTTCSAHAGAAAPRRRPRDAAGAGRRADRDRATAAPTSASRSAACARRSPRTWSRSKHTAAHFTYVEEVDVHRAGRAARRAPTQRAAERGVKLTFLPFIIKAVVAGAARSSRCSTPRSTRPRRRSSSDALPHRHRHRDRRRA